MAVDLDVTVGLDPFDGVVRVNIDAAGRRAQVDMNEDEAEQFAATFATGGRFGFIDKISRQQVAFEVAADAKVAQWLRAAASDLRAHKAGQVDLRLAMGKVPKA